jgi:hypothetical protein
MRLEARFEGGLRPVGAEGVYAPQGRRKGLKAESEEKLKAKGRRMREDGRGTKEDGRKNVRS